MESTVEFQTKIALNLYQLFFFKDYVKKLEIAVEKNLDHIHSLIGALAELNSSINNRNEDKILEVVFSLHPFNPKTIKSLDDAKNFLLLKSLGKKKNIKVSNYNAALKIREEVAIEFYNSALLGEMLKDEINTITEIIKNLEEDNKLFESQVKYHQSVNTLPPFSNLRWDKFNTYRVPDPTVPIKSLFSENQKNRILFRTLKRADKGELKVPLGNIVVGVKDEEEKAQKEQDGDTKKVYLIKNNTVGKKGKKDLDKICSLLINIGIYPKIKSIEKELRDMGFVKP